MFVLDPGVPHPIFCAAVFIPLVVVPITGFLITFEIVETEGLCFIIINVGTRDLHCAVIVTPVILLSITARMFGASVCYEVDRNHGERRCLSETNFDFRNQRVSF